MRVRFGRFSAVGLLGAALQVAVFDLLVRWVHFPAAAAASASVEMALLHNFFWHERLTWRDRRAAGLRMRAARLWRFHAANGLVSLAGNAAIVYILVEWAGARAVAAQVTAIAACAPANFLAADRWVYRRA